ncbi:MAG: hypothetical protein HQL52_01410, partial [Magnetococcales bacterium]|nr:hypothetical protein [Magnetococcales bacterium]
MALISRKWLVGLFVAWFSLPFLVGSGEALAETQLCPLHNAPMLSGESLAQKGGEENTLAAVGQSVLVEDETSGGENSPKGRVCKKGVQDPAPMSGASGGCGKMAGGSGGCCKMAGGSGGCGKMAGGSGGCCKMAGGSGGCGKMAG